MNERFYSFDPQNYSETNALKRRIEELEEVLKEIIADAMDNPTSLPAKVTWTSIHKAQNLMEES